MKLKYLIRRIPICFSAPYVGDKAVGKGEYFITDQEVYRYLDPNEYYFDDVEGWTDEEIERAMLEEDDISVDELIQDSLVILKNWESSYCSGIYNIAQYSCRKMRDEDQVNYYQHIIDTYNKELGHVFGLNIKTEEKNLTAIKAPLTLNTDIPMMF